eukprot:TRINITY_DN5416_c0_g1_i1.p1 TRINITY_DN5416_c0_g1~~TRINITY_DN5416_c0_g1_i1.p1  ORF type:complete len:125 (-),score=8.99 TRINITY_DN5416_c0_g1_i1:68-442(-)
MEAALERPADLFQQLYELYRIKFEDLFILQRNGSLKADWNRLTRIAVFVREFSLLIQTNSILVAEPNFNRAHQGDIATSNENKRKLLEVYSACFQTYVKVCILLHKRLKAEYNIIDLNQVELED